jgi:hypothetical protein
MLEQLQDHGLILAQHVAGGDAEQRRNRFGRRRRSLQHERGRSHSQRNGIGRALSRQPGHGAQGHRRTGAENLVVRRQGKGTFVATHAEQHVQYRFLKLLPDTAMPAWRARPSARCRMPRVRASADVARAWRCAPGDPVMQARRAVFQRRAHHSGRHLAARPSLQGTDGRADGRLPRPHLCHVRARIRRAHGARRGKNPRRAARRRAGQLLHMAPSHPPA